MACFLAAVEELEEDDFNLCKPLGRMCFLCRPHMSMIVEIWSAGVVVVWYVVDWYCVVVSSCNSSERNYCTMVTVYISENKSDEKNGKNGDNSKN